MTVLLGEETIINTSQPIKEADKKSELHKSKTIEGRILKVETRGPFNRSYVYDGVIADKTGSMYFSFFGEKGIKIKPGQYVKMQGKMESNKYKKDVFGNSGVASMKAFAVETIEAPLRKDEAEIKRVEFQAHTFMTQKCGAISPTDLILKANELGMKSIAITDVSVVQGFPDAHYTSKETGVKVIYGMQGKMVDIDPVVFHETSEKINDGTYVVFDVETTGFSSQFDDIIELAAVKGKAKYTCSACDWTEEINVWKHEEHPHICPNCEGYGKKKKKLTDEPKESVSIQLVVMDEFQRLIQTDIPITPKIETLTKITKDLLNAEGVSLEQAIGEFEEFKQDAILVAHNAPFDMSFLTQAYHKTKRTLKKRPYIDTLALSKLVNTEYSAHGLAALAKKEKVDNKEHHRALNDSLVTLKVLSPMFQKLRERGIHRLDEINSLITDELYKTQIPYEVTFLVTNQKGLKNLYKIVTESHIQYLTNQGNRNKKDFYPVVPWSLLNKYHEGIIIGTGSHKGHVFKMALERTDEELRQEMKRYDYAEIQPYDVARHLWNSDNPITQKEEHIIKAWKRIYDMAKELGMMTIATGHVQYGNEEDAIFHNNLLYAAKPSSELKHHERPGRMEYPQGPAYLKTTQEMLDSFPWLSKEEAYEVVVTNTVKLDEQIEKVIPIPEKLYTPHIEGVDEKLRELAYQTAKETYGNSVPTHIQERLDKELDCIIKNGYAVIYYVSHLLVKKSLEDGYLVGSRGSIGSSFAATMTGITEVNPLAPHYLCKHCHWNLFLDHPEISSGYDLPLKFGDLLSDEYPRAMQVFFVEQFKKAFRTNDTLGIMKAMKKHQEGTCPVCKQSTLRTEGQNIPFETFLGINGDKVPDIDLNFSGEYQPKAHQFIQDMFGEAQVFRAGTIKTIGDKTAFAIPNNYMRSHGVSCSQAEVEKIATGIQGAKEGTGQHPGGMVVIPEDMEIEDFTPCQYPANNPEAVFRTTHFDFDKIHDCVLKFDILGHDMPTNLFMMKKLTNLDPRDIPSADKRVLQLFYDTEKALGCHHSDFKAKTGTLGLPEMGTRVVQDMISETKPKKYGELLTLSGLSHGTDVYYNNAQDLISSKLCTIKDVIGCRDDIMRYLKAKGLDPFMAFTIMESVRKGKGLKPDWITEMKAHDVPDWYIDSCEKIKYMFPRAHASAYVTDAMRMGYYKLNFPLEFYAAMFSAKYFEENINEFLLSIPEMKNRIDEIEEEMKEYKKIGEKNKITKLKVTKAALNLALEAKVRGINFGNIRMYESEATNYSIDYSKNELIPPFTSVDGIGKNVATSLVEGRSSGVFKGLLDMQNKTKVKKDNIEALRENGCLGIVEARRHVFF